MIKAKDLCLVLVDVAIEGFIRKPPPTGTQLVELPTLQETQPLVEEVLSLDNEVKAQSEEVEEETEEESTIGLVCDEDFEIFYHKNMIEDVASTSRPATVVIIKD